MKKLGVVLGLTLVFIGLAASANAGSVLILDYHTFLGTRTSSLDFSDQEVEAQLRRMEKLGFPFVSLKDAIVGKTGRRLSIVLTIDDGNHSVYQAYRVVFQPLGLSPFLFLYPHAIDLSPFTLRSAQVHLLEKAGLDIGAHGYFHRPMGLKTWDDNPNSVRIEALQPASPLQGILGYRPTLFAYPYGVAPEPVQELVRSAGYTWAFAANDKIVPVDFSDAKLDHWLVPRTIVYRWNVNRLMKYLEIYAATDRAPTIPVTATPVPSKPVAVKS